MKKRLLYLFFPIVTLVLEILPYGAICNFANPEGDPWRRTFSYFDLTPFGYANFAPFLTAVITCVITALLLVHLFSGNAKALTLAKVLLCVCAVLSLCPLLLGLNYFSAVGALITVSLISELILLITATKS